KEKIEPKIPVEFLELDPLDLLEEEDFFAEEDLLAPELLEPVLFLEAELLEDVLFLAPFVFPADLVPELFLAGALLELVLFFNPVEDFLDPAAVFFAPADLEDE